jgi:Lar family restriction alleviation protein
MDEQIEQIAPCPFCGEAWIKVRSENSACFAAECQGCSAFGPEAATNHEAIAAWDTRAALAPHRHD